MALVRFGQDWVREMRDHFLKGGDHALSEGRLWICDPESRLWTPYTEDQLRGLVSKFIDGNDFERPMNNAWVRILNKTSVRREVASTIWDHLSSTPSSFFHDAPPGLAVGREWIAITPAGLTRTPLTADHRARYSLQMDLPQSAEPPHRYIQSLTRMFGDDADGRMKLDTFQEYIGACRAGIITNYERALIMPGGGSNGKSTAIMGAVEAIFSPREVRSITPNFFNQEYYLMELRGAAINCVTELPKEQVNCTERLKQIISGEDVTGRPIREMPVTFRPSAGHIFACNNFPRLSDNSKGMWRRLLVLRCDANFAKADGLRSDIVEAFKTEAPQILLWALEGARRLMERGNFIFPPSHFDEEAQWRGGNDRVLQFVADCTYGFTSGWTKAAAVHQAYLGWCLKKNFAPQDRLDATAFGSALRHLEGFQSKRQSHGKVYNFKMRPMHEWRDVYLGDESGGEVQLEPEVMQ